MGVLILMKGNRDVCGCGGISFWVWLFLEIIFIGGEVVDVLKLVFYVVWNFGSFICWVGCVYVNFRGSYSSIFVFCKVC